ISTTAVAMVTPGVGEASQRPRHPDGQIIAFSGTRGFDPGNCNIFLMDDTSRRVEQLTHAAPRTENPNWAPDRRHLAFAVDRNGKNNMQIFTMLADGTHVQQLTTQGRKEMPVWGK